MSGSTVNQKAGPEARRGDGTVEDESRRVPRITGLIDGSEIGPVRESEKRNAFFAKRHSDRIEISGIGRGVEKRNHLRFGEFTRPGDFAVTGPDLIGLRQAAIQRNRTQRTDCGATAPNWCAALGPPRVDPDHVVTRKHIGNQEH